MKIEFTEGEIKVLLQLIDIAVKSGGLNVAEASSVLAKKLTASLAFTQEVEESSQVEDSPLFAKPADLESVAKEEE
tara:strand:+ start:77 stop:304 length:228 start_codon:yes stop_codon:yes gene_type:complete